MRNMPEQDGNFNISISSISDFDTASVDSYEGGKADISQTKGLSSQIASIAIKDTVDVTFGTKNNFIGPVTIKQFVTESKDNSLYEQRNPE